MALTEAQPDALALTYAKSLFELAEAKGGRETIEATLDELENILELARANPRFAEFLSSRALPAGDRARSLDAIFAGRISDLTRKFLRVLNEKGRLGYLVPIVGGFDQVVQAKFGRVEVDVFTAEPMSPDEFRGVSEALGRALGKEIVAHPYVDASMIGGVKLRIGDQLVDGSVATRLRKMRDLLGSEGLAEVRARMDRIVGS